MIDSVATDHTRRNLLLALGAGSVGAAALAGPSLNLAASATGGSTAGWWERLFVSLAEGSADEWNAIRGQLFSVEGERGTVPILLSEVKLLASKGVRPREVSRQRAFTLVFHAAPGSAPAGERTYRLTHPSYPALDIYLDPARKLAKGVRLTAVFN
jgi:hypothetical protein